MIAQLVKTIGETVSERRIYSTAAELQAYHRIPSSEDYFHAVDTVMRRLQRGGLKPERITFPYEKGWDEMFSAIPRGWTCRGGYCELDDGSHRRLADYDADCMSIVCNSISCDYRDKPLEIVPLLHGNDERAYENVDFSHTLALMLDFGDDVSSPINQVAKWVVKRGGAGIILGDVAREKGIKGAFNQYDSIAWSWIQRDLCFGFAVSPKVAAELLTRCKAAEAGGRRVRVRCWIDAVIQEDPFCDILASIPGQTDESVICISHLCHPRPSVNDNLSGVSCAVEAAKVLHDLVECGALPRPKRTIRILLGPEMTGSSLYLRSLAQEVRYKIMGALALDMVGAKQGAATGPVLVHDVPFAVPSFAGALAQYIQEIAKCNTTTVDGGQAISVFHMGDGGYMNIGSDQDVWNGAGIPCPSIAEWPARTYHSSGDSLEDLDPALAAKTACTAAAYLWVMANLDVTDIPEIAMRLRERLVSHCDGLTRQYRGGQMTGDMYGKKLQSADEFFPACIRDVVRFFKGDSREQACALAEQAASEYHALIRMLYLGGEEPKGSLLHGNQLGEAYSYTPQKIDFIRGYGLDQFVRLFPEAETLWQLHCEDLQNEPGDWRMFCQLYADGHRTLGEIAERVRTDISCGTPEAIDHFIRLLACVGAQKIL